MAKNGSLPDLLQALRTAGDQGLVVHPVLLRSLMREGSPVPDQQVRLSGREVDVLRLLAAGMDARVIAGQLGISLNTCRGYVKSLLSKLHAHSQLEAVAAARRHGLLDLHEPQTDRAVSKPEPAPARTTSKDDKNRKAVRTDEHRRALKDFEPRHDSHGLGGVPQGVRLWPGPGRLLASALSSLRHIDHRARPLTRLVIRFVRLVPPTFPHIRRGDYPAIG